VFLFTGQGGPLAGAGRGLYKWEPVFREELDRYAAHVAPRLGHDLRDLLFAHGPQAAERLRATALAQPALVALELAMARLLASWGVRPAAVAGHSVGEIAAAAVAGVLSWQDALDLAVERGRLVQGCPPGAMTVVTQPAAELRTLIAATGEDLTLAALNAFDLTVVAGSAAAVAALEARLAAARIEHRRLLSDHAFHSPLVAAAVPGLVDHLAGVALHSPTLPWLSSATAAWMTPEEATDPGYWARQLRQPVRFADALTALLAQPETALVEVGPGQTLVRLARRHPQCERHRVVVACLPRRDGRAAEALDEDAAAEQERRAVLTAAGELWVAGVPFDSRLFAPTERRRLPLPTYPFERQRFWIDAAPAAAVAVTGKQADLAGWFHTPAWSRALPATAPAAAAADGGETPPILIFLDDLGLGSRLAEGFEQRGHRVVRVAAGSRFERLGADSYSVAPDAPADYRALAAELLAAGDPPRRIAHLFSVSGGAGPTAPAARFDAAQRRGYYSLLFAAQALLAMTPEPLRLVIAADRLLAVAPGEPLAPEKSTLLGPCRVLPQENPRLRCLPVDLPAAWSDAGLSTLAGQLAGELLGEGCEIAVAYRDGRRYVLGFQPLSIPGEEPGPRPLREGGVYLITGGLGGVGLLLAEYLATRYRARLVLAGRTAVPPKREWEGWLTAAGAEPAMLSRVRRLHALQALGAEIVVEAVDVADEAAMGRLVTRTEERFGALHGVIHAAGVTSGPSLYRAAVEIGREESEIQFRPKVHGVLALAAVLAGRQLDFVLLLSSNAVSLGGLGYVGYAAANAFMDAFAQSRDGTSGVWLSAGWDPWPQETKTHDVQTALDSYAMSRDESVEAFDRVVTSGLDGMVAIATGDFPLRLDRWVRRREVDAAPSLHARPVLRGAYVAPRNDTERALAALWREVLGLEEIGIHDSFFDLGGHSLLATRLVARMREQLDADLSLQLFFEKPTVAELAAAISAREPAADEAAREILAHLLTLSEEAAEEELGQLVEAEESAVPA
jgi:phthiocerol/phenolphthiocerol synthesis type-I polyketide synthase E